MSVELQSNVVNFAHVKAAKFGNAPASQALRFSGVDTVRFGNTVKFGQGEAKAEETSGKAPYSFGLQNFFNPFKNFWGSVLYGAIAGAVTVPVGGAGALLAPLFWILSAFGVGRKGGDAAETPATDAATGTGVASDAKAADGETKPDASKAPKSAAPTVSYKGAESVSELVERAKTLVQGLSEYGLTEPQITQLQKAMGKEFEQSLNKKEFAPIKRLVQQLPNSLDTKNILNNTSITKRAAEAVDKLLALVTEKLTNRSSFLEQVSQPLARLESAANLLGENQYLDVLADVKEIGALNSYYDLAGGRDELDAELTKALEPAVDLSDKLGHLLANEMKSSSAANQLLTTVKSTLDSEITKLIPVANKFAQGEAKARQAESGKVEVYTVYSFDKSKKKNDPTVTLGTKKAKLAKPAK